MFLHLFLCRVHNLSFTIIRGVITTFKGRGVSRRLSSIPAHMVVTDFNVLEGATSRIFGNMTRLSIISNLQIRVRFQGNLSRNRGTIILIRLHGLLTGVRTPHFKRWGFLCVQRGTFSMTSGVQYRVIQVVTGFTRNRATHIMRLRTYYFARHLKQMVQVLIMRNRSLILHHYRDAFGATSGNREGGSFLMFVTPFSHDCTLVIGFDVSRGQTRGSTTRPRELSYVAAIYRRSWGLTVREVRTKHQLKRPLRQP